MKRLLQGTLPLLVLVGLMGSAAAYTGQLPASLSLKGAASPFELRLAVACGPFYLQDAHNKGKMVFWDNYIHNQMDTKTGPNYVNEKYAAECLPRFDAFCKVLSELGCNAVTIGDLMHLVTFDKLVAGDPYAVYPKDSPYRARHLWHRQYFKQLIATAKKHGLDFYLYTDEFMYTPPLGTWIGEVSPENPRLWEAYRAKYDEVLTELPEIAGVIVRIGELYPTPGYVAKGIADSRGRDPINYRKLIQNTWEIVCQKHKKKYVHRTWSLGLDSITGQAYLYDRVWRDMPTENVIVSVKHTQTDFWYYNPVNPCLGVGKHHQIVEIQTRREYHSMGAFPDCPWQDYAAAFTQATKMPNVAGYWLWPNEGGGSNGVDNEPQTHYSYLKGFAEWNEANTYLAASLGMNPKADPQAVLRRWAAATYGESAAENVTEVLRISPRSIERGYYISDYAKHNVWLPLPHIMWFTLTREGYGPYKELRLPAEAARMISEASEATDLAGRQLALFTAVEKGVPNRELAAQTLDSLQHQLAFYTLMRDFRQTAINYFQARVRGGQALFNGAEATGEAKVYFDSYLAARRRLDDSLAKYDRQYHLYRTGALHQARDAMRTGSWNK
jgi:hypothetical protein